MGRDGRDRRRPCGLDDPVERRPALLRVREGIRGLKPLTDIAENIDDKVLHAQPIGFRSSAVWLVDGDGRLTVEGALTMAGSTRHRLTAAPDP